MNPPDNLPILRSGMANPLVKHVKAMLRSQGMWHESDSDQFGPKLKAAVQYFQGTHHGPDGVFLFGDGEIGPRTWWALYNPSGSAQAGVAGNANAGHDIRHMALASAKETGFTIYNGLPEPVRFHLGGLFSAYRSNIHEVPDGSNCGDGVDHYIQGFGPVFWCALFQSGVYHDVFGAWPMDKRYAHVQTFYNEARQAGHGFKKAGFKPAPGDLAIYCYDGGSGHITAVVAVDRDWKAFNTIGGNEGNRVKFGLRNVDEPKLAGFIRLHDYGGKAPEFGLGLLSTAKADELTASGTR